MYTLKFLILLFLTVYCSGMNIDINENEIKAEEDYNKFINLMLERYQLMYDIGLMLYKEPENSPKYSIMFRKYFSLNDQLDPLRLREYPTTLFTNLKLKRNIERLMGLREYSLTIEESEDFEDVKGYFLDVSYMIHFCRYDDHQVCNITFEELLEMVDTIDTVDEMQFYYKEFLKKSEELKGHYLESIPIHKKISQEYDNLAMVFTAKYEDSTIWEQVTDSIEALKPFYSNLHAYVRYQLQQKYGKEFITNYNAIPMEFWMKFVMGKSDVSTFPYPRKQIPSVDERFKKISNYTVDHMMHDAETFFTSMGLDKLPSYFWEKSYKHLKYTCKCSVLYPEIGEDILLRYCDDINMERFNEMHEIFTEVYYKLMQKDLPLTDREGYWPGYEKAMKGAVGLATKSRTHLENTLLYNSGEIDDEMIINEQYKMALDMLPMIFEDFFTFETMIKDLKLAKPIDNCEYWREKNNLMGVIPSIKRRAEQFDLGGDMLPFLRDLHLTRSYYINEHIFNVLTITKLLTFQFYEGLCTKAGQGGNLGVCDFSGSITAGNTLKEWMSSGTSKTFAEGIKLVTGSEKLSADAILKYFAPLNEFLEKFILDHNIEIGWDKNVNVCAH